MTESEMKEDGNDALEVTDEQEDKPRTRTTEIQATRRATKQEEKDNRMEKEREAEERGCPEWIEADVTL